MTTHKLYLAGPISGLSYKRACLSWRQEFARLMPDEILCYSPMRGEDDLEGTRYIHSDGRNYDPANIIGTPSGICARDFNDLRRADLILTCFLESARKVSLGTAYEMGAAHILNKPIVAVGRKNDPQVNHLMAQYMIHYRCDNLEQAADIVRHLLLPGI